MAIYLKAPNASGSVTSQSHKDWITIDAIEFGGVNTPVSMVVGNAMDRYSSQPRFSHVSIIKPADKSSNALFEAAHSGQVFEQLEFNYVSSGSNPITYGKLILKDAVVAHYADQHSAHADMPRELIRFAYTQMQRTFIPRDKSNKLGSPNTTGYDIEKASAL